MASVELLQAITVTCELTNTTISEAAARVLADDLSVYPERMVLGALTRCRKELRHRLTIADVVSRLDDGRPGPEEAWATIRSALGDENITVVWTGEMAVASDAARKIIDDPVTARMAFIECYRGLVQRARDDGRSAVWSVSFGYDASGREGAVREAVRLGRLDEAMLKLVMPPQEVEQGLLDKIVGGAMKLLGERK